MLKVSDRQRWRLDQGFLEVCLCEGLAASVAEVGLVHVGGQAAQQDHLATWGVFAKGLPLVVAILPDVVIDCGALLVYLVRAIHHLFTNRVSDLLLLLPKAGVDLTPAEPGRVAQPLNVLLAASLHAWHGPVVGALALQDARDRSLARRRSELRSMLCEAIDLPTFHRRISALLLAKELHDVALAARLQDGIETDVLGSPSLLLNQLVPAM
mmetsp:Transcript_90954/g.229272  ORF Transcript_90954/g.229272 Transcript_90954/m.229272 type:complete len:211 (-) Transcript_90954:2333-2965(-)